MAYNTKYYYRFASCNGKTVEIDVKQNGYSGSATLRRVGGAPVLRMEANDCIHGMSLELPAECIVEDEYADLYSTDPYLFQVDVLVGNSVVWKGFITPELYSAPWIDPPYDVILTATDGLGELKLHNFSPMGRVSIYSMLSTLLGYTGLSFAINAVNTAANSASSDSTMLTNTYVNLDHMAGETCYDVLQALLTSLHATIQQVDCAWLLIRETDVNDSAGSTYVRDTSGNYYDIVEITSMADSDCWPVGQLRMEIQPAKNRVDVTCTNHPHQNYLTDPNMVLNVWGNSYCTHHDEDGGYYELPPNDALAGIYQSIRSVPTPIAGAPDGNFADLTLHVKARQTDTQAKHRIKILIQAYGRKLGTTNTYASYWFSNDFGPATSGISPVAYWYEDTNNRYYIAELDEASVGNSADCTELDINIKFPELVKSLLALDNNYSYLSVRFSADDAVVCVHEATLEASTAYTGMSTSLILGNSARGSYGSISPAFADSYTYNYGRLFLDNICRNSGGSYITNWTSDALPSLPYGEFIAKDYAFTCAMPRLRLQGRLNVQTNWLPLFLKTNSMLFQTEEWTFDLLNDEVEVSILSLPAATLQVTSVTTTPLGTADAYSDMSTSVSPTMFNVLAGDTSNHYISISQVNSTSWSVSGYDSSWITFSSTSGSGTRTIYFSLSENSGDARSSVFTIAGTPVQINQEAGAFSFTPTTASVSEDNGSVPITISCGASQQWTVSSNSTWCTISGQQSHTGTGPATVYASYGVNIRSSSRTATLTVYKGSTSMGTLTLTQSGAGSVSITSSLNVGPVGNVYQISVTDSNNIGWSLTSSQPSWCTVSPSSGTGTATNITVTIGNNTSTTASRTAVITCTPTTGTASTCQVYQATATAVSISPSRITFDPAGSTEYLTITGTFTEWEIQSSPSWCNHTGDGGNTSVIELQASANTGSSSRSGSFVIDIDGTDYTIPAFQEAQSATNYTFTINPTPSSATVTINGATRTSYQCPAGTNITWSVAASGYVTQTGTYTMTAADHTENVVLSAEQGYTFTVVPTPSDATVTINGSTRTSYTCPAGTTVTWSVSKTGYTTQNGTYTMGASDRTEYVTLTAVNYTFTISASPSGCTVVINNVERTSYSCPAGTEITWSVSKTGYTTQMGSYTMTASNHTETVTLSEVTYSISVSPTELSFRHNEYTYADGQTLYITANQAWTATAPQGFTISANSGAGTDTMRVYPSAENTGTESITGNLVITGVQSGSATVSLTQLSEGEEPASGYFDMPTEMTYSSFSTTNYITCVPYDIDTSTVTCTISDPDSILLFARWYELSQRIVFQLKSNANLNVDHTFSFTVTATDTNGNPVSQTVTCYYFVG